MSTEVIIPKLGFSMSEGILSEWLAADGASVEEGAPLFVLETEKATQDIEAPTSGTLRILKQAGETYDVGVVIGEIA